MGTRSDLVERLRCESEYEHFGSYHNLPCFVMEPTLEDQLPEEVFVFDFGSTFLGTPKDSEMRKQVLRLGSVVGDYLLDLLSLDKSMPVFTAREIITIILVMQKTRKATEDQILDRAKSFPYVRRVILDGSVAQQENVVQLLTDITELLRDARLKFDVDFPPEGYTELSAEPKSKAQGNNSNMWLAWRTRAGAETAEEERDPLTEGGIPCIPYSNCDYHQHLSDWDDEFDEEYYCRQSNCDQKPEPVYVLPPGAENAILGHLYHHKESSTLATTASQQSKTDYLSKLPNELKIKIARYVLVLPCKLSVTATVFRTKTWPSFDQLRSVTYKFSLWVKAPRFMTGCYWSLGDTSTLLALLAVNKNFHEISKPIFYGENYFEVLDGYFSDLIRVSGDMKAGHQQAHRFLELLSWSRARDGTLRYGERPLMLIRKLNIDMELKKQQVFGCSKSTPVWHFNRITNALISIPHLNRLVINIRMTSLKRIDDGPEHVYVHPELWPGLRKLPWAASTIVPDNTKSSLSLKVYIPENRKVEKWLQDLIDAPDHDPKKLGLVTYKDWATRECPSEVIVQGLRKADRRYMQAWYKAERIKKEAERAKKEEKRALESRDDSDNSTDDNEEDSDVEGSYGDEEDMEDKSV